MSCLKNINCESFRMIIPGIHVYSNIRNSLYLLLSIKLAAVMAMPRTATPMVLSTATLFTFLSFLSSAASIHAKCNSAVFRFSGWLRRISSHFLLKLNRCKMKR